MIKLPLVKKEDPLEKEMARLTEMLNSMAPCGDDYQAIVKRLSELTDISVKKKESRNREKLSPNAIASGVIGLIEVYAIMSYEKTSVIATKAFSRIMRGRA